MQEMHNTRNRLTNSYLFVKFKGENAEWDRIAQEVHSLFIKQLLFYSCDGRKQFVPIVQMEFGKE